MMNIAFIGFLMIVIGISMVIVSYRKEYIFLEVIGYILIITGSNMLPMD